MTTNASGAPERIHVHVVFDDNPMRILSVVSDPPTIGPVNYEADYVRVDASEARISEAIETTHRAEIAKLQARVALLETVADRARLIQAYVAREHLSLGLAEALDKALAALGGP